MVIGSGSAPGPVPAGARRAGGHVRVLAEGHRAGPAAPGAGEARGSARTTARSSLRPPPKTVVAGLGGVRLGGLSGGDRSRSWPGRSFDVPFEYGQHAGLHRPDNGDVEPVVSEAFKPSGAEGLVTADDQTRAPTRQFVQQEGPEPFCVGGWPWLLRRRACDLVDLSTRAGPGTGSVQALRPATHRRGLSVSSTSRSRREQGLATPGEFRWHLAGRRCRGGPRSTIPRGRRPAGPATATPDPAARRW